MKVLRILVIAFIFTLVSGIYTVKPSRVLRRGTYAEQVNFGFPFHWLIASRSWFTLQGVGPHIIDIWNFGPWQLTFLWSWFIVNFVIYGLIAIIATSIYDKKLEHIAKPRIYRTIFWLSAVGLVVCCWVFIFWNLIVSLPFSWYFLRPLVDIYVEVESFLRFFIGVMTIIFTWFLIKYLKQVSTP